MRIKTPYFLLLIVCSVLVFFLGGFVYESGILRKLIPSAVLESYQLIQSVRGLPPPRERIAIDIKYKNYQKLAYTRKMALQKGNTGLHLVPNEPVPATLLYKNKTYKAKLRLKGDMIVHFADEEKWSFRIELKGDNTLWGMKRFSIHHPRTREYLYEWLFHRVLKREGLIGLRYEFIGVTLNGKDLGLYALEEHFGRLLVENNRYREGPIIRFSEDIVQKTPPSDPTFRDFSTSPIDSFETKRWTSPLYRSQHDKAVSLLEAFRQGDLKTSQVFDAKKLGTFFAITDLLQTQHGALWKSMRFYYNPITSKLEPVGFDGSEEPPEAAGRLLVCQYGVNPDAWIYHSEWGSWFRALFNDEKTFDEDFFKEYVKALRRFSEPSYMDRLFEELGEELNQNVSILARENPSFNIPFYFFNQPFQFSKERYYEKQRRIQSILASDEKFWSFI